MKSPENTENEVNSPAISTVVLKKKECIIENREGEKQNELRETKASVVSRLRGCDNRLLCDTNFIIIIFFLNPLHPNLKIHILHTRLYTLSLVRTRRILLAIKAS